MNTVQHTTGRKILILKGFSLTLLFINALGAIVAGVMFIADPSGGSMGMTPAQLQYSPFSNYLIPGIVLLAVNGLLSVSVISAILFKLKHYAWLIILQGVVLCGWLIVQLLMLRFFHPLHLVMMIIGIFLVMFGIVIKTNTP